MYDWANSAFPTVTTTFIFAAYFVQAVAPSSVEGTILWARTLTIAGLVVAFLSPVIGAIADFWGPRKPWLMVFSGLSIVFTAILWFVEPTQQHMWRALILYAAAAITFNFAIVFYDAMLPSIAPQNMLGRISGWGWAAGYAGGLGCLVISLWLVSSFRPEFLSLDTTRAEPVRATSLLVAIWFALFSAPIFVLTPDRMVTGRSLPEAVRSGLVQLSGVFAMLRRERNIARFLVAHMFYTDGLVTLFAFGGIYAATQFGMKPTDILLFGIVLNISAGLGAAAFGWIDDFLGSKKTITLALSGLIGTGTVLVLIESVAAFWVAATLLGIFVGPAQAAGRSLMARIAPKDCVTEMFGLYAFAGKATSFLGPLFLGVAVQLTQSQRAGIATIIGFFVLGLLILQTVAEPR